jgi:hypothetical protein
VSAFDRWAELHEIAFTCFVLVPLLVIVWLEARNRERGE